jgi:hypothetical protein
MNWNLFLIRFSVNFLLIWGAFMLVTYSSPAWVLLMMPLALTWGMVSWEFFTEHSNGKSQEWLSKN